MKTGGHSFVGCNKHGESAHPASFITTSERDSIMNTTTWRVGPDLIVRTKTAATQGTASEVRMNLPERPCASCGEIKPWADMAYRWNRCMACIAPRAQQGLKTAHNNLATVSQ